MDKNELMKMQKELIANHRESLKRIRITLYRSSTQLLMHRQTIEKSAWNLDPVPLDSESIEEITDKIKDIIDDFDRCHEMLDACMKLPFPPTP